jgi:hypothetical protein
VSAVAVGVVLWALMFLLVPTKQLTVILGLVLGSIAARPAINRGLTSDGSRLWTNVSAP